jgi:hypothetical protein
MYQIIVQGKIDQNWSDWLSGFEIETVTDSKGKCDTSITGFVADQADLRGILNHLWDLNLTILSVRQVG